MCPEAKTKRFDITIMNSGQILGKFRISFDFLKKYNRKRLLLLSMLIKPRKIILF